MTTMVGRLVGEYRLEMPIASGTLGSVFRARHVREERPVALKLINPSITSDGGFRDRFRREIGAAAALRHPHIVSILFVGEHAGQYYYVMEFVGGGSLRSLLQRADKPVTLVRGVEFVRQAAEALAFAHGKNVLHRDVKPDNLMVERAADGTDRIKVADFGLTRLVETGATLGNAVVGSPAYMSPEECRGSAVDARSDLYSLGIVLYEVATGFQPFQVKTLGDAVVKHISAPPPTPTSMDPAFSPELERIILRALAKRPDERYQSGAELAAALAGVLPLLREQRKPVVRLVGDAPPPPPPPPQAAAPASPRPRGPIRVVMDDGRVAPGAAAPPSAPPPSDGPRRIRVSLNDPPAAAASAPAAPPAGSAPPPGGQRFRVSLPSEAPKAKLEPPDPRQDGPRDSKRIRVLLQQQGITVTPGMQVVVQVTLVNAGKTVDHFHVSVEGIPEGWVRGPAEDPRILPDGRAPVALAINAPRSPESRAAEYAVVVRARSRENPMESGFATATLTVLPFSNTSVALTPARRRAWRRASYGITMKNEGNAAAAYRLRAADEEQVLDYRFGEERVQVPSGETVSTRLKTEAPVRWLGTAESRTFTVRAEREEGLPGAKEEPRTAVGQFVHRPIIPIWLLPVAIAVALVLLFLVPMWTTILLEISPKDPTAAIGGTVRLAAKVTNRKGEQLARPVTWESSDATVAAVDSQGVVTGMAEGKATITARSGKTFKNTDVNVVQPKVAKITVAPAMLKMKIGDARPLRASAVDAAGVVLPRDFQWVSSDPTVATVGAANGRVVAKGPGSASITAQAEGKSGTAEVTVAAAEGGGPTEDCVAYEPGSLKLVRDPTGWQVTDGKGALATLESESDARRVQSVAQRYKQRCFLGRFNTRPNRSQYIVDYWKEPTGIQTQLTTEECTPAYAPASLEVAQIENSGWVLRDRVTKRLILWADTQADASKAWEIAKSHTRMCVIGLNNRQQNKRDYTVWYWK